MDAQRAAREDANELQSYMKGLSTWLSEIKVKDEALKKKGKEDIVRVLPPIRGTVSTPTPNPTQTSTTQATSSSASSSQKTENEVNKKLANEQKDLGNDLFKKEKYNEAIECYTKSMNLDPANAIFPANRAMAYLKLKKYKEAESDCNLSISIDPNYAKAYHRRASARQILGRYKLAMADFEQVLKLDPASVQVKDEISKLKKLISEKPTTSTQANPNPPSTQQKNNNDNDIKISSQIPPDTTPQKKEETTSKPIKKEDDTQKSAKKEEENKPVRKRMTITEVNEDETKNDATLTSTTTPSQQTSSSSKPIITEISSSSSTSVPAVITKPKIVQPSSIMPTLPSIPPKTFFEFERTWHSIKNFEDLSYSYLKLIPPKTFPTIVKESMSNELIYEILVILRNSLLIDNADFRFVAKFMKHLVQVGRFEMITMFFTRREKHILTEIFEKIQPYLKPQQVESLKKLYGIN